MNKLSDEEALELWVSFKKGDKPSFARLFDAYYSQLISYGCKFSGDRYIVEESVQDLFVKLWNNRYNLSTPVSVKPYILKSFRSVIFRKLQSMNIRQVDRIRDDKYRFNIELPHDQKVIDEEHSEEQRKRIDQALKNLTTRQREAVYLRFYQGLSYEDISEVLQIETAGTYKLVYRALDRLREELGPILFSSLMSVLTATSLAY